MNKVYINAVGRYLPGEPVVNANMEQYIGRVHSKPSRLGPMILRLNRIKTRHYAIDSEGNTSWTAAKLVAQAVKNVINTTDLRLSDIQFLSAATSQSDYLLPGFASMVHGELGIPPVEIASFQSVCASSMMALKDAYLQVKCGEHRNAVVGAGEFASRFFQPGFYEGTSLLDSDGQLPMSVEFLRWTLSDGAGAVLLENKPNQNGLSLEVEWITLNSFANRFQPCMYAGGTQNPIKPWGNFFSPKLAFENGIFALQQDFELLHEMLPVWVEEYVKLIDNGKLDITTLDWFLCHYSSHAMRIEFAKQLEQAHCMIPDEKWFTNLYTKGNTGAASIFVMLEELFHSGKLKKNQKILCLVPESGRSVIAFMSLRVV